MSKIRKNLRCAHFCPALKVAVIDNADLGDMYCSLNQDIFWKK